MVTAFSLSEQGSSTYHDHGVLWTNQRHIHLGSSLWWRCLLDYELNHPEDIDETKAKYETVPRFSCIKNRPDPLNLKD
jgi:hypothetical protein